MAKPKRKNIKLKKYIVKRRKRTIKKYKNKTLIGFKQAVNGIRKYVLGGKTNTVGDAIKIVLKSAKSTSKKFKPIRIVIVPTSGGILELITISAGLIILGTLTGGAAAIAKGIISAKSTNE